MEVFPGRKKIIVFMVVLLALGFQSQAGHTDMSFDFFSQEDGLPNNQIQCIFQDSEGWMWFGTSQGISRFDGYEFVNFIHSEGDSTTIDGTLIRVVYEDSRGNLLIGAENGGLNVFNRKTERFEHPYEDYDFFKDRDISVNDIVEDKSGNLWLGTNQNIVRIDTLGNLQQISLKTGNTEFVRVLQFDNSGKLWAGTNSGLYIVDATTNNVEKFSLKLGEENSDEIWEIFLDRDGTLWIGTYSHGAFIVDPVLRTVKSILLEPVFERSKTVRSIVAGAYGNYWIGTRGGIYAYQKEKGTTAHYRHDDRELTSLINNSVLDIFHDRQGEIWIGTRGGLNLLAKSKQVFHSFNAHPSDRSRKYLNSSVVHAFWIDGDDNIWIGTEDGGVNIYHPKTATYEYLMADNEHPEQSVSRNCIKAFQDDKRGNLWIGTYLGGISVLELSSGKMTHFENEPENAGSLSDNRVWDFLLDKKKDIWVATSAGIDKYDRSKGRFVHYSQLADGQVNWIEQDSRNNIWLGTLDQVVIYNTETKEITRFDEHSRSFLEDSDGRYWIATLDRGIAQYSKTDGPIRYYTTKDGLCNNQALCLEEDLQKNIWISTSNGLSKFDPQTGLFQSYSSKDGLRNNQFTYGASYKTADGRLLFGSISGFNIFDPSEVKTDSNDAPVVLTELRIFNKKVEIGSGKKDILQKSITETDHLVLNYDQNVFTLEFAALNYINSESNLYSYYLEGFDRGWNEPSTIRSATYTNLYPDDYILHVKRIVPGVENEKELAVAITILPPFWKTTWFRILVIIIIGVLIYLLIQFFLYREKIKNELVIERMNARKLHELDMLKLKFFTNISHEIRTPLTLILAPLEKLISQKMSPQDVNSHLDIMYRNTKNLDRLINQLLDFRKLESGNLKLELSQGDIVNYVAEIVHSFEGYAEEKEIKLKFNTLKKRLVARFDADKVEKIVNNLLSNAFKFTGKGGKISVNLSLVFDVNEEDLSNELPEKEYIEISVRDTGQGISQTNTSRIFNRFFQANEKDVQTGTGIGLAFVKELVKLHKGKIFVESKAGKGSKFTVRIPFEKELPETATFQAEKERPSIVQSEDPADAVAESPQSRIMLVVEDNPDVRTLIKSHFAAKYKVVEAGDGKEGWKVALEFIPDIIISDILMPDVDGYEFCKKVKKDERTSHIPVLLLTALHSKEHEIKGLSSGADDFITKPFDLIILQTKVDNVLSIRNSLKEKYSGEITLQPKNIVISSPDEKFLQRAIEVVENNISDAELDIESFAQEVGVSRMQLYRKLHALTDMTVKEFIRNIRLKRATQLLLQDKVTVSEIAYAVGFKDLSHFRKCFRQEYGMNATEYKQKNTNSVAE